MEMHFDVHPHSAPGIPIALWGLRYSHSDMGIPEALWGRIVMYIPIALWGLIHPQSAIGIPKPLRFGDPRSGSGILIALCHQGLLTNQGRQDGHSLHGEHIEW